MELKKDLPEVFSEFSEMRQKSFMAAYELKQKNIPFVGTFCTYTPTEVIMAAGAFVQGSSIELSADGPIRPPYAVYFQGGLTWYHAKLGILMSLQKLVDAGLITLDQPEEK